MQDVTDKMKKAIEAFEKEIQAIRTGRANPMMLDRLQASYYGVATPVKAMANISNTDGRTLQVVPFDKSALKDIEKAIIDSDLGLTPNNDGNRILIVVPELTRDRREELVKQAKKEAENAKVSIRNVRRDALEKSKKDDGTEDDKKRYADAIQKLTDDSVKKIDDLVKGKEQDLLKV